jgi:hypothetical protein
MKNRGKIPALLAGLGLVLCLFPVSCRLPATTTPENESVYIIIEPCSEAGMESGEKTPAPLVTFKELSLETGTLDRDYLNPWAGSFQQGDTCFLLTGIIRNGYDEGCWVAYHATGYDASGNTISYTLDEGPIVGVAQVYIKGNSAVEFTLHLNWSEDVHIIKINSQKSGVMFP